MRMSPPLYLVLGAALLTAGCTGGDTSNPITSASATSAPGGSVIAPVMIDPATATEVTVPLGNTVVFNVDEPDKWTAVIKDPVVAHFMPGGSQNGWVANPALMPTSEGMTEVRVTGPDGASRTFVLTVKGSVDDNMTPDPNMMVTKETAALADSLKGMTETAAVAKVEATGRTIRIARRDKETFALTMDYRPDRINIEVDNGTVTSVNVG